MDQAGPKPVTGVFVRGKFGHRHTEGKRRCQQRQRLNDVSKGQATKGCGQPPGTEVTGPPRTLWRVCGPTDTLTLGFWPPEAREKKMSVVLNHLVICS